VAFNKVEGNRRFSNILTYVCAKKGGSGLGIPLQTALFLGSFRNFLAMTKKLLGATPKTPAAEFSIVALASALESSYISGFSFFFCCPSGLTIKSAARLCGNYKST